MRKLMKRIKVIEIETEAEVVDRMRVLSKNNFKSYKAVANMLEIGESATVAVYEYLSGKKNPLEIFAGYGEVEKVEGGWNEPRRLMHEY